MDIHIEPHVGMKEIPGVGFIEQDLKQDRIYVDGVPVGYVGRLPDAGICLVGEASEAAIHHIRDAVDKHKQMHMPERKVAMPPKLGENPRGNVDE